MKDEECWKECEYANPKSEIISAYLMKKKEDVRLKQQIEKLLDFCLNYVDECDVCELTDTCINSEGVCPFAKSNRDIKKLILKHINRG